MFEFYGYRIDKRTAQEFEFRIPAEVDSYEQGVALIAYYFRNTTIENKPLWLIQGLEWKAQLPWEKRWAEEARERALIRTNLATLDHEWFRVLIKKLKNILDNQEEITHLNISFNGQILLVKVNEEIIMVQANGNAWNANAVIESSELVHLPKRIKTQDAEIILYKDSLYLGNSVLKNIAYQVDDMS